MLTPSGVTFSQYTQAIMNGSPTHVKLVALNQTYNEQPLVFTDDDIEASGGLHLNSYLNAEIDLTMGRAVMDELTIALFRSAKTDAVQWCGNFRLDMGVEIGNDTVYVTVGYYVGQRPDRYVTDDVISFQLYDRMYLLERPSAEYMNSLDFTQGITIADLYHGLCTFCGVEYVSGDELTDTMTRTYLEPPFSENGYTCREVMAMIAEANCCYARINAAGKMQLIWYSDHLDDYTVRRTHEFSIQVTELDGLSDSSQKKKWVDLENYTWNDLRNFLWQDLEGESNPLRIYAMNVRQMEEDSGVVIPQGTSRSSVYLIVDNPFLKTANNTEVSTYLEPIYDRLCAFGAYIPMDVTCRGNWLIEAGDVISVEIGVNNQAKCPIFTRELAWNGAIVDKYEATGNLRREAVSPYNNRKMIAGGRMHQIRQNIDEMYERIQDELGNYSTVQQTAAAISLAVAKTAKVIYAQTAPTGLNRDAEQYSSLQTYDVGDFCIHAGLSYRCTTAVTTPEAWDSTKWTVDQLPLTEETIWVDTTPYLQTEADDYDDTDTYAVGDLVTHGGNVYQCNTAITTAEAWTAAHWDLYETAKPKNQWNRWDGSAWVQTSENTTYTKQSGIEITNDGVSIHGSKFVKIQAESAGEWFYDKHGLTFDGDSNTDKFRIGQSYTDSIEPGIESGIFDYRTNTSVGMGNYIKLLAGLTVYNSGTGTYTTYQGIALFDVFPSGSSYFYSFRPVSDSQGWLGRSGYQWGGAYINEIHAGSLSASGSISASGNASITGQVSCNNVSTGRVYASGKAEANNLDSQIWVTGARHQYIMPNYNVSSPPGYHNIQILTEVFGHQYELAIAPSHKSDDTYLYLGLPTYNSIDSTNRQIKCLYTENSPVVGSSREIKHAITGIEDVGDLIDQLKPCTYIYDTDGDERVHTGFVYEDMEKVFPLVCDNTGGGKGIAMESLIPYLVKEIQCLRQRVAELERKGG